MPDVKDLASAFLFFLPGFVALKVFYVLGLRTTRTDLEWTVWSVLTSIGLFAITDPLRTALGVTPDDNLNRLALLVLGIGLGLIGAWLWNRQVLRQWRWRFVPEPWDLAYLSAVEEALQAVVELDDGREAQGDIEWMGLSGEGSSRSITLLNVQMANADGWVALAADERLHIPETSIHLLRLVPFRPRASVDPNDDRHAESPGHK